MRRSTSIKPLQSVIVPSSVNISETPLSAEVSSADAAEGARFVSSASISDSVVKMKNTLPINTSPFRSNYVIPILRIFVYCLRAKLRNFSSVSRNFFLEYSKKKLIIHENPLTNVRKKCRMTMQYVESSCAVQECRTIPHGNITAIERKGEITMKSTGVVRQLDTLGRIVLPIELRRTMDIGVKDMLEIFVEGDEIILKKYHPSCIFCSDARDVVPYKGKLVCKSCLAELRNAQD